MPRQPFNPYAGFPITRQRAGNADALRASPPPPDGWGEPRTPLTEAFTEFKAWPFWVDAIQRGTLPNISGDSQAWFKFGELNIRDAFRQSVTLHSVGTNLGATDATGQYVRTGLTVAQWGDFGGQNACIVFGVNLGGTLGQWEARPAPPFPSLNTTYTGSRFGTDRPGRVLYFAFPPGNADPATFNNQKQAIISATTPLAWMLQQGDTVDVFFVVLAAQFNGAASAAHAFGMMVQGQANFALTYGTQPRAE